jgi:hypothetical protein
LNALFNRSLTSTEDKVRVLRFLIGRRDAGELFDLTRPGAAVNPFGIALFTDIQRATAVNLDEITITYQIPHPLTVSPEQRDECIQTIHVSTNSSIISPTRRMFCGGKPEFAAQVVTNVVTVR